MDNPGSVTMLIQGLQSPDSVVRNEAARQIWDRFSAQLLGLARSHLSHQVRVRADEDDVVQSAFKSLCARMERGRFADVQNRDDL